MSDFTLAIASSQLVVPLTLSQYCISNCSCIDGLAQLQANFDNKKTEAENLKASAKAKLIAGEPLTEEEANTIVL